MKYFIKYFLLALIFSLSAEQSLASEERPIELPRSEGSKSFDMEISTLNETGIRLFEVGDLDTARNYFSKAESLARQFRDPGLGAVSFNLGLTLHKLNLHEEAVEAFATANKYARGNTRIINSKLLHLHECGFNPSIQCKFSPPPELHIEGSN